MVNIDTSRFAAESFRTADRRAEPRRCHFKALGQRRPWQRSSAKMARWPGQRSWPGSNYCCAAMCALGSGELAMEARVTTPDDSKISEDRREALRYALAISRGAD